MQSKTFQMNIPVIKAQGDDGPMLICLQGLRSAAVCKSSLGGNYYIQLRFVDDEPMKMNIANGYSAAVESFDEIVKAVNIAWNPKP